MVNYLYPGQEATRIWVPEMGRFVDQYDSVYNIPDTGYENDYVAVPQSGMPPETSPALNQPVYGRLQGTASFAGGHPGVYQPTGPLAPALIPLLIAIVYLLIVIVIAIVILYIIAKQTTVKQVADPGTTTCEGTGEVCTSYIVQEGFSYYRWDCCTGAMTAQGSDWLTKVMVIVAVGVGGFIAIKLLGSRKKEEVK